MIGTARINNPWGHMQVGVVVRTDTLNDGQYLDQTFVGYGGTISGDVHPFSGTPGPLGKDDLGFGFGAGIELGRPVRQRRRGGDEFRRAPSMCRVSALSTR